MIIQPIKISGRITELLSKREVFICPKGYASILYKDKYVYNINEQYEFQDNKFYYAPQECRLFEMNRDQLKFKDKQGIINSIIEKIIPSKPIDHESFKILDFPSSSYLSKLAYLGIDNSIIAIEFVKANIRRNKFLETVLTFRPRYKSILKQKSDEEFSLALDNFKTIKKFLLKIPFKYILKPMGKGKFLHLKDELSRSVVNEDVLKMINGATNITDWAKEVSEFKPQAISSLIFHSQIFSGSSDVREEYDVLDYIFDKKQNKQEIINIISKLSLKNTNELKNFILETDILEPAINNLTIDLLKQTYKWQNTSFDQIYKLVSELPRKLKVSKMRIDIKEKDYPTDVLKLSVYILSSTTENRNVISKIDILHRLGLRRIQDLILFNTNCRGIFKDINFLKNIPKFS